MPSSQPLAAARQPVATGRAQRLAAYGLTPRAFLIGTLLIPLLIFWNIYSDIVAQSTELAVTSLSIGVVSALLALLAVNFALKKWLPRFALSQAELLFIYIMQTASIGISSVGMIQFLNMMLTGVFRYATPENGWADDFQPYLRAWAFPDPTALKGFYLGQSSFFTAAHLRAWI